MSGTEYREKFWDHIEVKQVESYSSISEIEHAVTFTNRLSVCNCLKQSFIVIFRFSFEVTNQNCSS